MIYHLLNWTNLVSQGIKLGEEKVSSMCTAQQQLEDESLVT